MGLAGGRFSIDLNCAGPSQCEEDATGGVDDENVGHTCGDDNAGNALDRDNVHHSNPSDSPINEPVVGMTFPTVQDVQSFYEEYAEKTGFGVVKTCPTRRQIKGKATDELRSCIWRCDCHGKPDGRVRVNGKLVKTESPDVLKKKRSRSKKCGCRAYVYAKVNSEKLWEIKNVILQHTNHVPTPSKSQHISKYRQKELQNPTVARTLFKAQEANLPVAQIHKILALERNGFENLSVTQRDVRNHVDKNRRIKMAGGDANAMIEYLERMKSDNNEFFYTCRTDNEGNLKDILWVDARCKAAYEEFGDVVCFDATYLTNRSQLPFCNFVGVNSHGQTILFGCALISHEDTDSFCWVFSSWLEAMKGVPPGGLLTDQDAGMRKAMSVVMPETRHRWCLWHIMKKFSEKLGKYSAYKEFKKPLRNAVYDSLHPCNFEESWLATIEKYDLSDNTWLSGLYNDREMWVPAYTRQYFWAGMKTTQRSESIHSFFDGFVNRKTRLFEFPRQYCYALEVRADQERKADANCWKKTRELLTPYPFERQFREAYTDNKFREIQVQFDHLTFLTPVEKRKTNDKDVVHHVLEDVVYKVHKKTNKEEAMHKYRSYIVWFNTSNKDCGCECQLFETHGIMCRHLIKVHQMYHIEDIPPKFLLRRWRKDIPRKHMLVKVGYHDPKKTEEVKRFDKLMLQFEALCAKAALLEMNVPLCLEAAEGLLEKVAANNKTFYEGSGGVAGTQASTCHGFDGSSVAGGGDGSAPQQDVGPDISQHADDNINPSSCPMSNTPPSVENLSSTTPVGGEYSAHPNLSTPCQGSNKLPSVGDPVLWRKKKGPQTGTSRLQSASEKAVKKKAKDSSNAAQSAPPANPPTMNVNQLVNSSNQRQGVNENQGIAANPMFHYQTPIWTQHQLQPNQFMGNAARQGSQQVQGSLQMQSNDYNQQGDPLSNILSNLLNPVNLFQHRTQATPNESSIAPDAQFHATDPPPFLSLLNSLLLTNPSLIEDQTRLGSNSMNMLSNVGGLMNNSIPPGQQVQIRPTSQYQTEFGTNSINALPSASGRFKNPTLAPGGQEPQNMQTHGYMQQGAHVPPRRN